MSLKSIDTQLSLSRARDVGAIQNHMNQKPTEDQASLALLAQKQLEEDRKKLSKANHKSNETNIKDQQSSDQQGNPNSQQDKSNQKPVEHPHPSEHPYKGHRFDISL
jgi:hypothetical protein